MLNQLKNVGLSENEAKVYIAMLELGPATVLDIASKAGINRPTAYVQIESLKKRGLVSTQTKGKKTLFIAESPNQLESMLERENKDIELKRDEVSKVLPELMTMFSLGGQKPQVRFFEGREGLTRMQEEFLKSKDKQLYAISNLDNVFAVFPRQLNTYTSRRVEKGIRSRILYTSSEGKILPDNDAVQLREAKFIDPRKLPFSADITVYDDNVAIASLKGTLSGAVITQHEIAESFRNLFGLIWNLADKL